jgi:predicted phage-related endonuclease
VSIDQTVRRKTIGGSEIGAVLGCDERCDPFTLVARKRGEMPPLEPTERMLLGQDLEQGVLCAYTRKTGYRPKPNKEMFKDDRYPFMTFTPDALIPEEKRGVEVKFVNWDQRHRFGATADDIPSYIQLQCCWYMAGTGYPNWDVAALLGDDLRIYEFERDMEVEEAILAEAEEFYRRYLIGDERPPMGTGKAANDWLQRHFPKHKAAIRPANDHEIALLTEYSQVRAEMKGLKDQKIALEVLLKASVGEAEGVQWPHGKFTWKKTRDRYEVNWEGLAKQQMEGFAPDEIKAFIQQFSEVRHGTRKIYFKDDSGSSEEDE